jgi:arylsulfatase
MNDHDSSPKHGEGRARRAFILVVMSLVGLIVVVALFRSSLAPVAPQIDLAAPTHYFISQAAQNVDVLSCNFTRAVERSSSHDLWSLPLQPCSLVSGWANPTTKGVMAEARHSKLWFRTASTDWTHLLLRVKAVPHPAGDRTQTMSIRLNKHEIGSEDVPTKWRTVSVDIPPEILRKGINTISLGFAYRAPQASSDKRRPVRPLYAVDLQDVALKKTPERWGERLATLRRIARKDSRTSTAVTTQVYDRDLRRFVVTEPGTLIMPLPLPRDADHLEVEFSSIGTESAPAGEITVNLEGMATGKRLSERFPMVGDRASASVRRDISVASLAGETCILWIGVDSHTENVALEITTPRIIERPTPIQDDSEKGPPAGDGFSRPDIVMITLDAARADHFSCYGYDRPTTPYIDRLAAESLVFTNAFALVPNTRRSVPTMITGLSFTNHRVTDSDSTLSQAATTMAEHLLDAGYRTACFSASPNNSRAIGDAQGYEEFFELWNEVPRRQSRNPHYLSARVLGWLGSVDDSRPLHLQLHFVPPHAPYQPSPVFDLFTDPSYDGICDGSPKNILRIDKGKQAFDAADMEHLIALYDGNLRAADDAVEEVLSALRQRPRWKDTVVLVTSDHGEAFYEHRRMGHNNTVYDEMLRVPFVLRLPGASDPKEYDLDRLVTLADIAPTLLATASAQSDSGFDGRDVLRKTRHARGPDNGLFVARTAHHTPTWGLRSRRFKIILSNSGQGKLYDLVRDPGERHNLRFSSPEIFVGLGLILTRNLIEPPSLTGGERLAELPDSDREMLEALGYVE